MTSNRDQIPSEGLIVITGATASGKSSLGMRLASERGFSIVSADSRQIYRGMSIGTAAPTAEDRRLVRHYFVGTKEPTESYSAFGFATDALPVIGDEINQNGAVLVVGGSYLYIRALLYEQADIPPIPPEIHDSVWSLYRKEGLEPIHKLLSEKDPVYLGKVDQGNYRRLLRALEVSMATGKPFSSFHSGTKRTFPFPVTVVGVRPEREALYRNIDLRVDRMIEDGLVDEVRTLIPYRNENALQTIGYKEIFRYLYGELDLKESIAIIKRNTRDFARHQITSFKHLPTDLIL